MHPQANPYAMPTTLGQRLGRASVSFFVVAFGLIVLRLILTSLPMLKHAGLIGDTGIPVLVLVKALLDAGILALFLRYTFQASALVRQDRSDLGDVSTLILLLGGTITATFAYNSFQNLQFALAPEQGELYNWLFILIVLGLIAVAVVTVVRRLDFFTTLLYNGLSGSATAPGMAPAMGGHGPPQGAPPPQGPPAQSPELAQFQVRSAAAGQRVASAQQHMERRQASGLPMDMQLHQSAVNMQTYFQGAHQSASRSDWAEAARGLDWAEYEAGRVMAAGN